MSLMSLLSQRYQQECNVNDLNISLFRQLQVEKVLLNIIESSQVTHNKYVYIGNKRIQMQSHSKNSDNGITSARKQAILFEISDSNVEIYSNRIVIGASRFLPVSTDDTAEITVTDTNAIEADAQKPSMPRDQIIMFNNPDYAFNIVESQKTVQIHNLAESALEAKFSVGSLQTLMTVQSFLRKKMCELGFDIKYKIVKYLGKGATAEVHLVERVSDKKLFAAKIISIKRSHQRAYDAFINEAKLLRLIRHRNIVQLQSLYIHKKQLIQVLEYLSGGTLLDALRNNLFTSKEQKWKAIQDMTRGLDHLREKRIVHRDLKMENIMIRESSGERDFVLTDFGLACWIGHQDQMFEKCGTPGYIAPEVLSAKKGEPVLDHRTDVFSLGVLAHIIFTHRPLFEFHGNVKQLLRINKKAEYNLQSPFYATLTSNELSFLQATLNKNMKERLQAHELLRGLESFETPKKKGAKHRSINIDMSKFGVAVTQKQATSLTKKPLSIDIKSERKLESKEKQQQSRTGSARKMMDRIWNSFVSPSAKKSHQKEGFKVKQNSLQKHRQMKDFCI